MIHNWTYAKAWHVQKPVPFYIKIKLWLWRIICSISAMFHVGSVRTWGMVYPKVLRSLHGKNKCVACDLEPLYSLSTMTIQNWVGKTIPYRDAIPTIIHSFFFRILWMSILPDGRFKPPYIQASYPLVMTNIAMENEWKLLLMMSFPMKNGDFP